MNEISRLKLENEELFKSVNLLNDKVGKVKYHKAENYYLSAPCSLYSYESKGESMAITSGKIEKTSENCCVSLYIDGVFVDKKECAQDGSFLFVYYLPQSKSSTVSLTCSEENAQVISVRTFIAGNVVVYYNQTAKACSTENGTVYARVKNGKLNLKTADGQSVFFDECSCFDIAKSEQGITQIVQNANDKLVLSVVQNGTVINQNLYTFLNGEERLLRYRCRRKQTQGDRFGSVSERYRNGKSLLR